MGALFASGIDRLIHDFHRGASSTADPVLAFTAGGTVMQNSAARRFNADDLQRIHAAARVLDAHGHAWVRTTSGQFTLQVQQYSGAENFLIRVRSNAACASSPDKPRALVGSAPTWVTAVAAIRHARRSPRPVLLSGEGGTGKTSLAVGAAFDRRCEPRGTAVIDAGEIGVSEPRRWLLRVRAALHEATVVVIGNVDILDRGPMTTLRSLLREAAQPQRVVLTVTSADPREVQPTALMFGAQHIRVPPLRERSSDLRDLWLHFVGVERPDAAVSLDSSSETTLREYRWPGNLKELETAVAYAVARADRGTVFPQHFPPSLRSRRSGGLLEEVEMETIRRAVRDAGGNRTRAAAMLGISRATLYRKERAIAVKPSHMNDSD